MWEERSFWGDGSGGHGSLKDTRPMGVVWEVWSVRRVSVEGVLPCFPQCARADGGRSYWWEQHEKLVLPLHKTSRELEKMLKTATLKQCKLAKGRQQIEEVLFFKTTACGCRALRRISRSL